MCGEKYYRITLAELWTEAVLYGIYLALFGASFYILVRQKRNARYLAVTIALFIITTATAVLEFLGPLLTPHLTVSTVINNSIGFLCTEPSLAQEREELISDLMSPIQVVLFAAGSVVADGLLIYRCVILWGYNKWLVAPLVTMLIGATACNIANAGYLSRLYVLDNSIISGNRPDDDPAQQSIMEVAARFSNAAAFLSLALTVVTTTLITVRIWIVARDVRKMMGRSAATKYHTAMTIIVESGVLYALCIILNTAADFTISDGSTVIFGVVTNFMLPIAPTLVMVRVGMGKGFEIVQDSAQTSNLGNGALGRNVSMNGGTEAVSTLHFRTVQEAESETSDIVEENDPAGNDIEPRAGVLDDKGWAVSDDVRDVA